jgi:hypothetical protein
MEMRYRLRSEATPSDAMHQALGEFLTEMGRLEFRMLLLMDLINEAPLEALLAPVPEICTGRQVEFLPDGGHDRPANQERP